MLSPPLLTRVSSLLFLSVFIAMAASCGDDDAGSVQVVQGPGDNVGFGDGSDVVVVDGETYVVTGEPGRDCVNVGGACVDLSGAADQCREDDAQIDVIVVDGEVVDVLCYPPKDSGTLIEEVAPDADGNVTVPQNEGGSVITFTEETDGEIVEGDVRLDAERTILYGNGVDATILGGNLTVESNNSQVRSLTVQGNVTYTENANGSTLSFCKVQGNLHVQSNSFTAVDCLIFGNVHIEGNGAILADIGVGGEWHVDDSTYCSGCYSFDDADDDFAVLDEERGDELTCPGQKI